MRPTDRLPDERARQADDPDGYYARRREHYRNADIAGQYDATRFSGRRQGRHQREERVLLGALKAARLGSMLADSPAILDVPAGTGRFVPALQAFGASVIALDVSHEMLAKVRERVAPGDVPTLQADATMLPLRDRSVDACVSMRFFFHLPRAVRIAVLRELARVSRGCVVVEYRHAHSIKHWIRSALAALRLRPTPQPRVTRREIHDELDAAGLTFVATHSIAPLLSDKWLVVARPQPSRVVQADKARATSSG